MIKLNVLLAKTDHSASQFKKLITEYIAFFKSKQGEFRGVRKTYSPKDGTVDEPTMRGFERVVTTVSEKLTYLQETTSEYIDNLFSVEATNASGKATAVLEVEGVPLGTFSSLELLRLKSLLESSDLETLYANIPVRKEDEIWEFSGEPEYLQRDIVQSEILRGTKRGNLKETYILSDPNISYLKDTSKYTPQLGQKDTVFEYGDYTMQKFSGEATHVYRAGILRRRSALLNAVIAALKTANEVEAVESQMTAAKLFTYLHGGI
jgi:hypothetical protein